MPEYFHNHHIIPKHMGGTDDPSNLAKVTVEEHMMLHKQLWEEFGYWQDEIAYKGLAGILTNEECIYESIRRSKLGNTWNIGKKKSEDHKKKLSFSKLGSKNPNYGKKGLFDSVNTLDVTCEVCGLTKLSLGNYTRWHGKNCTGKKKIRSNQKSLYVGQENENYSA